MLRFQFLRRIFGSCSLNLVGPRENIIRQRGNLRALTGEKERESRLIPKPYSLFQMIFEEDCIQMEALIPDAGTSAHFY